MTGRLGKGVLIATKTFKLVQWFELLNPMTVCAFSHDDKEFYIVDSNGTLYIFDAQLPTCVAGWEIFE